jgi:hypothetical protein
MTVDATVPIVVICALNHVDSGIDDDGEFKVLSLSLVNLREYSQVVFYFSGQLESRT